MAKAKLRYKSRKEQNAAMEAAYAQLSRAMGSLNEMDTATASGRGGVSKYQLSQARAFRDADLFGEFDRNDTRQFTMSKDKVRRQQLTQAYFNRTDKIMQANVGG